MATKTKATIFLENGMLKISPAINEEVVIK